MDVCLINNFSNATLPVVFDVEVQVTKMYKVTFLT